MTKDEAIWRLEDSLENEETLLELAKFNHDLAFEMGDEFSMRDIQVEISIREHNIKDLNKKLSQLLKKA